MKHLDLFSGIGGFALAARWVGWETVGFCEIDPYCQKVLRKHWPDVPIYEDVKAVTGKGLRADGITPSIITGGFPCQDISYAGKGAGIRGERSGLWAELCRIIGEVRPQYALLENVSALLSRGLDTVLGDLAEIGYDCEWHCIPASHVGAPHIRDRVWIIAYPQHSNADESGSHREEINIEREAEQGHQQVRFAGSLGKILADSECLRQLQQEGSEQKQRGRTSNGNSQMSNPILPRLERLLQTGTTARTTYRPGNGSYSGWWAVEPAVGRVANGIPKRVDRLRGLGNAIVPQVAEVIMRAINEVDPALTRQRSKQ